MRTVLLLFILLFSIPSVLASERGDCNTDGRVNSRDALLALKMSVGETKTAPGCDMNADRIITSLDAAEILRIAVGAEECGVLFNDIKDKTQNIDFSNISFAGILFGNERISIEIEAKEVCRIGIITRNARVTEALDSPVEKPTILASLEKSTAERLLENWDVNMFKESLNKGEIKLQGVGVVSNVKLGLAKLAANFL